MKFKFCFCLILRYKGFLTVLLNIYSIFLAWWSTMSTFHRTLIPFRVRNDFSHAEQESQEDKKMLWPSHFKRFKLQHKEKKLKSGPSYHLLKNGNDKKCQWQLERNLYSVGVLTHTLQPQTQRDLQSRFGREKIIQSFKLRQIVKKNSTRYSS